MKSSFPTIRFACIWKEIADLRLCAALCWRLPICIKLMLVDRMLFHNSAVTPMAVAMVVCLHADAVTVFCSKLVGRSAAAAGQKGRLGPGGDGLSADYHHRGCGFADYLLPALPTLHAAYLTA
jgi:hypothetical protein